MKGHRIASNVGDFFINDRPHGHYLFCSAEDGKRISDRNVYIER